MINYLLVVASNVNSAGKLIFQSGSWWKFNRFLLKLFICSIRLYLVLSKFSWALELLVPFSLVYGENKTYGHTIIYTLLKIIPERHVRIGEIIKISI